MDSSIQSDRASTSTAQIALLLSRLLMTSALVSAYSSVLTLAQPSAARDTINGSLQKQFPLAMADHSLLPGWLLLQEELNLQVWEGLRAHYSPGPLPCALSR